MLLCLLFLLCVATIKITVQARPFSTQKTQTERQKDRKTERESWREREREVYCITREDEPWIWPVPENQLILSLFTSPENHLFPYLHFPQVVFRLAKSPQHGRNWSCPVSGKPGPGSPRVHTQKPEPTNPLRASSTATATTASAPSFLSVPANQRSRTVRAVRCAPGVC